MKAGCIWGSVAGLGLVLVVAGAVLGWAAGPAIVKSMVHKQMDLTDPESDGYEYFIVPPVPAMIRFTFFEVSNHLEVIAGTAKPNLTEKGPYVYREDMVKQDLKWVNNESQFLEFGQYKTYTFVSEESCSGCTEDDKVRMLNMPVAGLIAKLVTDETISSTVAGIVLGKIDEQLESGVDELFALTTVADFLFRGIKTGVTAWMIDYSLTTDRLPPVFRENGFALFNGKQNTSENECYQVETSAESWDRHTMLTKWGKDLESLSEDLSSAETCSSTGNHCKKWWPYADADNKTGEFSTCNQLRGTDGHQFPPFVNKKDQEDLWLFNTLPCRSIFMRYSDNVNIEGISALEYTVPLDGANVNKKVNVCTCKELSDLIVNGDPCVKTMEDDPDTLDISNCTITSCYDGLQDISVCQGAPTLMSYPHFYLAPAQQDNFDGLAPNTDAHRTFLNVEPNTGTTLRLHSRVQLNTPVFNSADLPKPVTVLNNIVAVPAFPLLWIDEGADIDSDPEMIKKLKKELVTPLNMLNIGKWVAIGAGLALFALGGVMTFVKTCGTKTG